MVVEKIKVEKKFQLFLYFCYFNIISQAILSFNHKKACNFTMY